MSASLLNRRLVSYFRYLTPVCDAGESSQLDSAVPVNPRTARKRADCPQAGGLAVGPAALEAPVLSPSSGGSGVQFQPPPVRHLRPA